MPHAASRRREIDARLPPGWSLLAATGPGPFITHARLRRPDGSEVEWTSRRNRKGLGLRRLADGARPHRWLRHAEATSWWMGALFGLGSVCFALGSLPLYFDAVDPATTAWTFFVGSVFFTSAALVQFHETQAAPDGVGPVSVGPRGLRALFGYRPRRIDWWASGVQLVGTVFFNVTTFAATRSDLSLAQERRLIWAPDVAGSICFLAASWFAYSEVNRGILPRREGSIGWWIATLNMAGSVAFGVAAVAARYQRSTGEIANLGLVNLGTFLGALGFFVGALLLPVESARETVRDDGARSVGAQAP